jgi:hypothetical protein
MNPGALGVIVDLVDAEVVLRVTGGLVDTRTALS